MLPIQVSRSTTTRAARKLKQLKNQTEKLGFLEAVGGAVGLAVTTPDHLRKLGYIDQNPAAAVGSNETRFDGEDFPALPEGVSAEDLHYLLSQALDKVTK